MRSYNFLTDDTSHTLYHVTQTKNVPKIQKRGILTMQPTNWVKAGSKERYGDGSIFAFDHKSDAIRWALKWDWEINRTMGSGKLSIIEFTDPVTDWEIDDADPLSQSSNSGRWLKRKAQVKPEFVTGAFRVTPDAIKLLK